METLQPGEEILRLLIAAGIGMAIGLEREWREKAAGFRTLALVSAGAAAFVLATMRLAPAEVARMAAGVSTGIGFLGAGTILRLRGEVMGLTTAASVWIAAALGIAAATGATGLALAGTGLALFILTVLSQVDLERYRSDSRTYEVTYAGPDWDEAALSAPLTSAGLRVTLSEVAVQGDRLTATWRASGRHDRHDTAIRALGSHDLVSEFSVSG